MKSGRHVPELLAPAGNLECLHAAVSAGADAVYLGLDEFNARRNADNFTLESLHEACAYAHLRGVAIYVTLNIELLPSEIDRAVETARAAYEAGADAFIVQDLGLAARLACFLPRQALHISTQMNIHSAAGIAAAARLGAGRVTLARELTLAEIAELAQLASEFNMEVETFAHGALCICYSGQCLMSSMIGGRSANRGLCAQACRLPYELHRDQRKDALPAEGEHLLSPRDLCAIDLLDELTAAGVASLKIEGRMKSADYVHEVVSVYREVLDGGAPATDVHRARLAEAFSRGFTTAYMEGQRDNDIMSYGRPNNRGVFAGRVAKTDAGMAFIAPEIELHAGDVAEFWTNRGHFAATLTNVDKDADGLIALPIDQRAGKGDRVFRVRNAATAFTDDAFAPRVPVQGFVTLRLGEPARVAFSAADCYAEAEGDMVDTARTRAVSEQDVRDHVDRLGQTPFTLTELQIDLDENVGIGFSQLHHLRAEALEALQESILAKRAMEMREPRLEQAEANRSSLSAQQLRNSPPSAAQTVLTPAAPSLLAASESSNRGSRIPSTSPQVFAWATNPACARAAKRSGADALYVPLLNFRRGQAQLAGVRLEDPEQAGYPKQCIPVLPTIDHDPVYEPAEWEATQASSAHPMRRLSTRETDLLFEIWDYVREDKPVYADSIGSVLRALEIGAFVEVGPHVPVTNRDTIALLADWGVMRIWLSPELTLGQIAELAENSPVPLGITVSGAQELMICEHCLLMSCGPCAEECATCPRRSVSHRLVDRKGFEFPAITDMMGRSHLYNGIELDAVPNLPDFIDMGITAFMVDTTLMEKKSAGDAVARTLRALALAEESHRAIQKRPNTTTGHLFRGVS